jgi:hypothetical protein
MKKIFTSLFVLSLIVIAFAAPTLVSAISAGPAHISAPSTVSQPEVISLDVVLPDFLDLARTVKTLTGFALLGAAILNVCKDRGWIKDNEAPGFSLIFQSVIFLALLTAQLFGKMELIPTIDQQAGFLAAVINSILAMAYQIYAARLAHTELLAGMPVIGTSYSGRLAGDQVALFQDVSED